MVSAECVKYTKIWEDWQRAGAPSEKLNAEVRDAIDHIASCPDCFMNFHHLSSSRFLESRKEEVSRRLPAFLEAKRKQGITAASIQNPQILHLLVKERPAFDKLYTFSNTAERWEQLSLPQDFVYTVERQRELTGIKWSGIFSQAPGHSIQARLTKAARASIEFAVDIQTGQAKVSRRMVRLGRDIPDSPDISVGEIDDTEKGMNLPRVITISTDEMNASAEINVRQKTIRVLLNPVTADINKAPVVALMSDKGKVEEIESTVIKNGYEVLFQNLETGNYLLAFNIIDIAATPVKEPERAPGPPNKEGGGEPEEGKKQRTEDFQH